MHLKANHITHTTHSSQCNAKLMHFAQLWANLHILVQVPRRTSLSPFDYWLSSRCDLFPSFQGSFALMKSLRHALPRFYHLRSSFAILGAVLAPVLLPVPADVVRSSTYIPYSRNLGPIRKVQRKWLLLPDKDGRLMSYTPTPT